MVSVRFVKKLEQISILSMLGLPVLFRDTIELK